jgi:hypothetical protein
MVANGVPDGQQYLPTDADDDLEGIVYATIPNVEGGMRHISGEYRSEFDLSRKVSLVISESYATHNLYRRVDQIVNKLIHMPNYEMNALFEMNVQQPPPPQAEAMPVDVIQPESQNQQVQPRVEAMPNDVIQPESANTSTG